MIDRIWGRERGHGGSARVQEEGDKRKKVRYIEKERDLKACPEFKKNLEQEVRRGWRSYTLQAGGELQYFSHIKNLNPG